MSIIDHLVLSFLSLESKRKEKSVRLTNKEMFIDNESDDDEEQGVNLLGIEKRRKEKRK